MDPVCSCHDVTFDWGSLELFLQPERAALSTSQSFGQSGFADKEIKRFEESEKSELSTPCALFCVLTAKSCSSLRELRGKKTPNVGV